jgi:hypothetical protein
MFNFRLVAQFPGPPGTGADETDSVSHLPSVYKQIQAFSYFRTIKEGSGPGNFIFIVQ